MAETIWDTRFFKPVSSVVTSSRAASAFSARCVSSIFSSAQDFFLAVKLVFNFSVSARLNWSLESADLISASWSASRVLASVNCEPNSDRAFYKTYTGVSRFKLKDIGFKSQVLCTAIPLDTWGLMSAKAIFYDSYIFQVPSALQSNSTWHLGANAWYSESLSRLSWITIFEWVWHKTVMKLKVPAHLWSSEPALGDYRWSLF